MSFIDSIRNHTITQNIRDGLAYPLKPVFKGYDIYNRTVEDLTKKLLPPTAAKVVQEFARSLPFTLIALAAILYVPPIIFIPGAIAIALVLPKLTDRQNITWLNAKGMGSVVLAVKSAAEIANSVYPVTTTAFAVIFLALAAFNFYDAYNLYPKIQPNAPLATA